MSLTVTLHLWWLLAYLAIGVVLWLPLCWLAWRSMRIRQSFCRWQWLTLRADGFLGSLGRFLLMVALWPSAVWEQYR